MYNPFYHGLAKILVKASDAWDETWAWRIVHFIHAIPYMAAAWGFGYLSGWFWQAPHITPIVSAWTCFGAVSFFIARDWFRDWRRG
jgi:hypothetical protein